MPEAAAVPDADPTVIDLALFKDPLRTVQALRNSGIIPDDKVQSDLLLLKRINRALYADHKSDATIDQEALAGMRAKFQQKLQAASYAELVEQGAINKLLDDYLGLLIKGSRRMIEHLDNEELREGEERDPAGFNALRRKAEARLNKYIGERGYYESNPAMIKEIAKQFEQVVRQPGYLGTGKIVALSGACGPDGECVQDLANDVLGVQTARSLQTMLKEFADDEMLARYAQDPEANAVRIKALAGRVAQITSPLSSLREFEPEASELDRIVALKTLVSAQLHYAIMQERSPEQMIAVERDARSHVADAAQVALSLAYDYLAVGPAREDKRTRTIQANLKKEMENAGIAILPLEEAIAKAAELARKSAGDLLQATQGDQALTDKVVALAKAAGAEPPLSPAPQLIGEDLLAIIKQKLKQPNIIMPSADSWTELVQTTRSAAAVAR